MNKEQNNSEVKPFNSQKQLQQHIVDKFAKHGNKVKYNFKIKLDD